MAHTAHTQVVGCATALCKKWQYFHSSFKERPFFLTKAFATKCASTHQHCKFTKSPEFLSIDPTQFTILLSIGILPSRSSGQRHINRRTTIRVRSERRLFLVSWAPALNISYRPYSKASTICQMNSTSQPLNLKQQIFELYYPFPFYKISNFLQNMN